MVYCIHLCGSQIVARKINLISLLHVHFFYSSKAVSDLLGLYKALENLSSLEKKYSEQAKKLQQEITVLQKNAEGKLDSFLDFIHVFLFLISCLQHFPPVCTCGAMMV